MLDSLIFFGQRHRNMALLFLTLITIITGLGLTKLKIDTSQDSLINKESKAFKHFKNITQEFGTDTKEIKIYVSDPLLFTPNKMAELLLLHERLTTLPFVEHVHDIFTIGQFKDQDGALTTTPLIDPESPLPNKHQLQQLKNQITADKNLNKVAVSKNGEGVVLKLSIPHSDHSQGKAEKQKQYQTIEQTLKLSAPQFQHIFQLSKDRLAITSEQIVRQDMIIMASIAALFILLFIMMCFRSVIAAFIPFVVTVVSIVWAMGLMGWLGIHITVLSSMLPVLLFVMGTTEETHMLSAYFHAKDQGSNQADKRYQYIKTMLHHVGRPIILTLITSIIGFLSFAISDMKMIQDFAYATALAMLANGLVTLLLVPILLHFFGPVKPSLPIQSRKTGFFDRFSESLNQFSVTHKTKIILTVTLLMGVSLLMIPNIKINVDGYLYLKEKTDFRQDMKHYESHVAGLNVMYISIDSTHNDYYKDPAHLSKLQILSEKLRDIPGIDHTFSIADQAVMINQAMHKNDPKFSNLPSSKALLEQYLLFVDPEIVSPLISYDWQRANIYIIYKTMPSHQLDELTQAIRQTVQNTLGKDSQFDLISSRLIYINAARDLVNTFAQSILLVLAVIFILLSFVFTSFWGGLLAMIPNVVPLVFLVGLIGLTGITLNPGTTMVAAIIIGIAVDDTIHLFSSYNHFARKAIGQDEAVKQTVISQFRPVFTTSLALAIGFMILTYSSIAIIADFGLLAAFTILIAMLADLVVTPIFLRSVHLVGLWEILSLNIKKDVLKKSELFKGMSVYEIKKAILLSTVKHFSIGQQVITQGQTGQEMYLVLSGQAKVFINHKDNQVLEVAQLKPGEIFGEIGFVCKDKRTATVEALEPLEVIVFDLASMKARMKRYPKMAAKLSMNISQILGTRLAKTNMMK